MVHWPLMGGLLHSVQRWEAWAGRGQCTNFIIPCGTITASRLNPHRSIFTCPRYSRRGYCFRERDACFCSPSVRPSVHHTKWTRLLQVKTKTFQLRAGMHVVPRTVDFVVWVHEPWFHFIILVILFYYFALGGSFMSVCFSGSLPLVKFTCYKLAEQIWWWWLAPRPVETADDCFYCRAFVRLFVIYITNCQNWWAMILWSCH